MTLIQRVWLIIVIVSLFVFGWEDFLKTAIGVIAIVPLVKFMWEVG